MSRPCDIAVVKQGVEGASIRSKGMTCVFAAQKVNDIKDTTGAGDIWAAGFIYGFLKGCKLSDGGHLGAVPGAEAVRHLGTDLPAQVWEDVSSRFNEYIMERY